MHTIRKGGRNRKGQNMKCKIYEYLEGGQRFFKENVILCGYGWELEVELPDFVKTYESVLGETIISIENSYPQTLSECLRASKDEKPCLCIGYSNGGTPTFKYYNLKVISREEINLARYL